jgi:neuronal calcium sensor 1
MGKASSKLSQETITSLSQKTRFTSKDLMQWHRGFIRDCPSGSLSRPDLCEIYKRYFPFGDAVQYATFIFRILDTDLDGSISFEEFITALDVSAKGTLDEKLECMNG